MLLTLQGRLDQVEAERDRLDARATTAEQHLAAATSELEKARLSLKVKLEEQQNQFRAIEEEQYSEWEKRVSLCAQPCCQALHDVHSKTGGVVQMLWMLVQLTFGYAAVPC